MAYSTTCNKGREVERAPRLKMGQEHCDPASGWPILKRLHGADYIRYYNNEPAFFDTDQLTYLF